MKGPVIRGILASFLLFAGIVPRDGQAQALDGDRAAGPEILPAGAWMLASPAGDTIARIDASARATIEEVRGDWVRLRIDGWVRRENISVGDTAEAASITLGHLRSDPDRYVQRTVRWRVQYLALERADSLRADMNPGEHFMLVRDPGGETGLVYVVVPPADVPRLAGLAPLERIEIVARIRTAQSTITGHPVLELVDIRR